MLKRSLKLCQAASPITKAEFLEAFVRVFTAKAQDEPPRLGLAVSGGVDSMALAVLCKEYLPRDIFLNACVVDHGLRPSSSDEASKTVKTLKDKLGIASTVWKLNVNRAPKTRNGIETWARTQRVFALISYFRLNRIHDVLTAHHSGDQHENILHRMGRGGRHSLGMKGIGNFPDARTTFPSLKPTVLRISKDDTPRDGIKTMWEPSEDDHLPCLGVKGVADLHMTVRRPLLPFSKERLIATCYAFNIPWVEDESNADRTLTPRNALRHILANHKLPAALSLERLSALHLSETAITQQMRVVANKLTALTDVEMDLRTGSAIIKPPSSSALMGAIPELEVASAQISSEALPRAIGMYIADMVQLVNCGPVAPVTTRFEDTHMKNLFMSGGSRKRFNHSGVNFAPLQGDCWLIYSEGFRRSPNLWRLRLALVTYGYAENGSTFQNFDYRWWVKVWNPSPTQKITLRYLRPCHLKQLRARLAAKQIILTDVDDELGPSAAVSRNLETILDSLGPKSLAEWLPVLVVRRKGEQLRSSYPNEQERGQHLLRNLFEEDPDAETVLALPTLNLRVKEIVKNNRSDLWWLDQLRWEVFYKHLDHMEGRLHDAVVLPKSLGAMGIVEEHDKRKRERRTGKQKLDMLRAS